MEARRSFAGAWGILIIGVMMAFPGCEKPSEPEKKESAPLPAPTKVDKAAEEPKVNPAPATTAGMSSPDPLPPTPLKKVVVNRQACPKGAELKGAYPPKGDELWCELEGKRHGDYTRWHDTGKIAEHVTYRFGKQAGPSAQWDSNGRLAEEGNYKGGKRQGRWKSYRDGHLYLEGDFKDDVQHGLFRNFAGNGVKQAEGQFKDGQPCGVFQCWSWETGDPTGCKPLEPNPDCTLTKTGAQCPPCTATSDSKTKE